MQLLSSSPVGWLAFPLFGIIFALLIGLLCIYFRTCYSYWSQRGVGSPDPVWGIGNLYPRLRPTMSMAEFDQWLYQDCGGSRFCGFYEFLQPVLMVGDPEILKGIMVKDFDHFSDRSFVTFNDPVMDHMLLGLKGHVWKRVRSTMTPIFSSGKVKQTQGLIIDCATNLVKYFKKQVDAGQSVYEMKDVYGTFTMDTIASIAFGVSSDSLNNTQDEFTAAAARFFAPPTSWQKPFLYLQLYLPQLTRWLGATSLDRTPTKFFSKVVSDTMKYRLEHNLRRNDFLQLLLDASVQEKSESIKGPGKCPMLIKRTSNSTTDGEEALCSTEDSSSGKIASNQPSTQDNEVDTYVFVSSDKYSVVRSRYAKTGETSKSECLEPEMSVRVEGSPSKAPRLADDDVDVVPVPEKTPEKLEPVLSPEVITAQCVLFYMAGYDTTATTLSFVSYCLALHPAVQHRLMTEIENTFTAHNNQLTYEAIQHMTYLDMVFAETLRLYPPAPRVDRRCTKRYTLPGSRVTIEPGTKITIPIYSIHRDVRYFPDPEKFNPDRFSPENKNSISQLMYMPFGSGPRNCIGKRFALMEVKVALVLLLQEFAFLPCKRTQVPIQLERTSGLLKAQNGVWLRLAKRVTS